MEHSEDKKITFFDRCENVGRSILGDSFKGVEFPDNQPIVVLRSTDDSKTVAMGDNMIECLWKALNAENDMSEWEKRMVCNWYLESDGDFANTLYGLVRPKLFPFEKKI